MNLVSIIVPVYNVENYLARCIDSILKQSYNNLQIILVDDGSIDKSAVICDKYADRDSRILVIHKTNGGVSEARNIGIDNAKGDYICFIDSDDFVCETYVEDLLSVALKYNADISMCLFEKGNKDRFNDFTKENQVNIMVLTNLDALEKLYDKVLNVNMVVLWNKLYSTKLFDNIRFPVGKLHEDEFIIPKLLLRSNKIIINKYNYYYFQSPNSIMRSDFKISRLDAIEAYEERIILLRQNNLGKLANKAFNVYIYLLITYICILDSSKNKKYREINVELMKKLKAKGKKAFTLNEVSIKLKMQMLIFYLSPKLLIFIRNFYKKNCEYLNK